MRNATRENEQIEVHISRGETILFYLCGATCSSAKSSILKPPGPLYRGSAKQCDWLFFFAEYFHLFAQ